MAASRRQIGALAATVAALAITLWWQLREPPASPAAPRASTAGRAGSAGGAGGAAVPATLPKVELDLLTHAAAEPVDTGRDPFRFGSRRSAAAEAGDAPARGGRPAGGGLQGPGASPPASGPVTPPPPPPIPLKFIGIVQKQGDPARIAVLSDGRGVYHGREGDIIEGRYRIVRIGPDVVEMVYVDGRGRQVIRLSGG